MKRLQRWLLGWENGLEGLVVMVGKFPWKRVAGVNNSIEGYEEGCCEFISGEQMRS